MSFKLLSKIAMVTFAMAVFIFALEQATGYRLGAQIAHGEELVLLSESEIHKKIIKSVQESYKSDLNNIAEISPPRLSPIRTSQDSTLDLKVVGDLRNGRLPIELSILKAEKVIRRQRLFVKIDFFTKTWALKSDYEAGHKIELDHIHEVKVPSRKISRDHISNPELAIGAQLIRASKANTPLKKSLLRIPKLIKRASIVELIFKKGGIYLVAEGEALGDGKRGDMIKVKNLKSKKIVTGRVIGVNKVDVGR